jgi:DNA-binding NarL/FixJ family response regulator
MSDPIRVMIVDDHEILRQGVRFMLAHEPTLSVVDEASSGQEALDKVGSAAPDVILLDVKMPGLDGLSTLRRLREAAPDVAVVILSMYDDPEYVEDALLAGASGYLLKTAAAGEIVRAVNAAASGDGYLQAEITRPILRRFASAAPTDLNVSLSTREREVLRAIADGKSTKQAAKELGISESTVKTYLRQLFEKMGASHRAHAVALAIRNRIID